MKLVAAVALLAVPLLGACPKPRTSAATQPSPIAFDVSKSDPKAVEVVDAGIAALGGYDAWANLKELTFSASYELDGTVKSQVQHRWDRWNGRHRFEATDMSTLGGAEEDVKSMVVKHDLFDLGKTPYAAYNGEQLTRADAAERRKAAAKTLTSDLYLLTVVYKAKDPGVILKLENAEISIADETVPACKPSCTSVKLSFEAGVGTDTWYLYYNNESKLPEVLEMVQGAGRIGYMLLDWQPAGGLKLPTKIQNIGHRGEIYSYGGFKVGEPDDNTYEVQVR